MLRCLVRSEQLEPIEGDLVELFRARINESGLWHARVRYWIDTLSIVRQSRRVHRATRARPSMTTLISTLITEIRFATRALAKRPGYAAIAACTLALGIGSSVAIFTVLNAVVLRPLPYPDSDRIVEVLHHAPGLRLPELRSSPGLIAHYQQTARSLASIAGYEIRRLNLSGTGAAERVRAVVATPTLFDVLATPAALGRLFRDDDAGRDGPRAAVLTEAFWRSRYGADPAVIGRFVHLDGRPAEIVGVLPPGFAFPDHETQVFLPQRLEPTAFGRFGMTSIARLAPGTPIDAARREIDQLQQRIPEWFPELTRETLANFGWSASVQPLHERVVASVAATLWMLFGAVCLVLLVAAANVANLFLVRADSRQRELAVKSALGAGRARIAAAFVAEGLVLATIAAILGLLLAEGATRALVTYGPPRLPRLQEVRLDVTVLAFTAAVSASSAVLLTLLPALGATRRSFNVSLRGGGRCGTSSRARSHVRKLLIVTQVAMVVVLLICAGLLLRSMVRLRVVDPGVRVQGVLVAALSAGAQSDRSLALATYRRILDELAALPGVSSLGAATILPVGATALAGSSFDIRSRPRPDTEPPLFTMHAGISPGYFETLGVPILEGRLPERGDEDQRRPVAWVNKTFARQFLEHRAVGESIHLSEAWVEIVGVVGDVRTTGLRDDVAPMVYLPLTHGVTSLAVLEAVIRTDGDAAALAPLVRSVVDRVDSSVPITTRTMDDVMSAALAPATFTVTLVGIAAALGVVLGVVGLYGALSYIAAQRTSEIAVRLALGAKPAAVCAMVLRQGLVVTVSGIVIGLAGAWASARLMSSMLFGISAYDPVTYVTLPFLLLVVSMAATYVPARRAAATDPVQALRIEA